MGGDSLGEGLLISRVKSTDFESGRLTGAPGFNDSLKGRALELTIPAPLGSVCGISRIGKPEELENVDCTET